MTFADLIKAFDTVSREWLWKIKANSGCPPRFIAMVWQFYDDMQARVPNDGDYSIPFPVNNGVIQGCLVSGNSLVQHGVFCHADRCFS